MNEATNWKTLYKKESWGNHNFGVEIRVSIDRDLNENDQREAYRIGDEVEAAIMRETLRTDPNSIVERAAEHEKLLGCFPNDRILAEEIPNGYCSRWCCVMSPWYKVTTSKGIVTIGWRKRVISISWEPRVGATADELFPDEDVSKFDRTIHAWSYGDAARFIARLLAV